MFRSDHLLVTETPVKLFIPDFMFLGLLQKDIHSPYSTHIYLSLIQQFHHLGFAHNLLVYWL